MKNSIKMNGMYCVSYKTSAGTVGDTASEYYGMFDTPKDALEWVHNSPDRVGNMIYKWQVIFVKAADPSIHGQEQ